LFSLLPSNAPEIHLRASDSASSPPRCLCRCEGAPRDWAQEEGLITRNGRERMYVGSVAIVEERNRKLILSHAISAFWRICYQNELVLSDQVHIDSNAYTSRTPHVHCIHATRALHLHTSIHM
jgi:hypothetical protein